jgi:MFS family permease
MVGPALGGFVIHFNTPLAYLLNAGFLVSCFLMTLPLPNVKPARTKEPVNFSSLLAGVRFVFRSDLLVATMTLDLFAVLLGGAVYPPHFATDILHVGSLGYGVLRSAPAVGALCMAMLVAHAPPMQRAGRNLLLSVAGFGAANDRLWAFAKLLPLPGHALLHRCLRQHLRRGPSHAGSASHPRFDARRVSAVNQICNRFPPTNWAAWNPA